MRKKRSANFTKSEEQILISLLKKYQHIVECKATDSVSNKNKMQCWLKIEKEFNSESGEFFRTVKTLKKKYEHIKRTIKKKFSNQKCNQMDTGVGHCGDSKRGEELDEEVDVKEILGSRLSSFESEFWGDENDPEEDIVPEEVMEDELSRDMLPGCSSWPLEKLINDSEIRVANTEPDLTPISKMAFELSHPKLVIQEPSLPQLKRKALIINELRKIRRNEMVTSKISNWVEMKSLSEMEQKKESAEIHQKKLKHMDEKHEAELRVIREKAALEKRIMQAEHAMRMELMKKKLDLH